MLAGFGDIVSTAAAYAPGERLLDGESGSMNGVDLSPAMLSVAPAHAADEGLGNVTFDAADAAAFQPDSAGFLVAATTTLWDRRQRR